MKVFKRLIWWWKKRCPKCGGTWITKAYVGYKSESFLAITKTEQVCVDCGYVRPE